MSHLDSPREFPKTIRFNEKELPAVKTWEVGKKYKILL